MRAAIAGLVFSGLTGLAPFAAGQVVVLPGSVATTIHSISDNGTRVAGTRSATGAYLWSEALGFRDLTYPDSESANVLLSGDGHAIATTYQFSPAQTFIETDSGEVTVIPFSLPGQVNQSIATGISRDGSVVCGWDTHTSSSIQIGWRWSASGGMQILPFLALTMSGDGTTVFGSNGFGQHLMWRDGVTTTLPANFPGRVQAANYDGNIFGGDNWIWNHGQVFTVQNLPGGFNSTFTDMSEDGGVVVGVNSMQSGPAVPFIWTPTGGTRPLGAYFASYGYDLSAYRITNVHVSADGRTFGLTALDATSARGIIVTVPSPASAAALFGLIARAGRRATR
ncbi:MAG: hypothetical protein DYG92_08135 [Leptolyngbya sp. PLA1]|nr:hypothetical protein [Leptolyngbya sp. PLA1]